MKTKEEVIYMPDLSAKYRPRTKTTPRKAGLPSEAKTVDRKVRFGAGFEAEVSAGFPPCGVPGFPSPAADYEEDKLDLNRYLIKNPARPKGGFIQSSHSAGTFFVRATPAPVFRQEDAWAAEGLGQSWKVKINRRSCLPLPPLLSSNRKTRGQVGAAGRYTTRWDELPGILWSGYDRQPCRDEVNRDPDIGR